MRRNRILICLMLILLSGCIRSPRPRVPMEGPHGGTTEGWVGIEEGLASWYGGKFHGRLTANGERYDMYRVSAAHKTLPLGTRVLVRNNVNGRTLQVRINDRGPFVHGRIIDLSYEAARQLDMVDAGVVPVTLFARERPRAACYSVQVGAFSVRENARSFAEQIREQFELNAAVIRHRGFYKVRVGRYETEEAAEAAGRKLNLDFFIVSCD